MPEFPATWALKEIQLQTAGEDAFDGNISDELIVIPFSFLKVCLNKYLRALAAGAGQVPPQQAV